MTKRLAAGTMWRHFLLSGAAFAVASAWPSAAFAHATLVRSEPADRAVLASAPRELRFVFS
jgi:methionine-rich copper-binding protein CopC